MATTGDLQRVAALVKRLAPLASVERGEPIRADDWNLVVGALVELARATLSGEAVAGAPDHDHADEVKLGWLDPSLRTLIERGPLADPAKTAELQELGRVVGRLGERVGSVEGSVTLVRDRVAEVVTKDITRGAEVRDIRRVVDGLGDAREDVAALRGTLDTVRGNVAVAVAAARQLTIDGQPLDVGALMSRVVALETARDRLKLPNGELLDAVGLEQRFAGLAEELVTEAELKAALDARPARLSNEERAALERSLAISVGTTVDDRTRALAESLRAEVTQRLAAVDAQIASAVAAALPGALDGAAERFRADAAAMMKAALDALAAQLDREAEELRAGLVNLIEQRIKDVWAGMSTAVAEEVARAVERAQAENAKRFAVIEERLGSLEKRFEAVESGQRAFEALTAGRLRELTAERAALEQKLVAEMTRRDGELTARLEAMIAALEQSLRDRLETLAGDRLTVFTRELERLAATAAQREMTVLAARLRGEMHEVARDEIAAAGRVRPR